MKRKVFELKRLYKKITENNNNADTGHQYYLQKVREWVKTLRRFLTKYKQDIKRIIDYKNEYGYDFHYTYNELINFLKRVEKNPEIWDLNKKYQEDIFMLNIIAKIKYGKHISELV